MQTLDLGLGIFSKQAMTPFEINNGTDSDSADTFVIKLTVVEILLMNCKIINLDFRRREYKQENVLVDRVSRIFNFTMIVVNMCFIINDAVLYNGTDQAKVQQRYGLSIASNTLVSFCTVVLHFVIQDALGW